jgi:hypothetical protein
MGWENAETIALTSPPLSPSPQRKFGWLHACVAV